MFIPPIDWHHMMTSSLVLMLGQIIVVGKSLIESILKIDMTWTF